MVRATTACTFSTSQLPKVVRTWCVLHILTSKCASRHNGVQFFIAHLASWLRTRRFSEPTFRPSGATNHWKNTVFRDFPTFSRICIFFLPDSFSSDLLSSNLPLLSASALLCFSSVHIVGSLTSKLPSIIIYIYVAFFFMIIVLGVAIVFFPTCQVRVFRFYVSCLLLSSSPLLLLLLNRDPRRTLFSVGPQPRPSTPSVPCRTSTTTIPAQCSLPDLNHDHPRPVFPAGPQPRVSTPCVPCRTSCRKLWTSTWDLPSSVCTAGLQRPDRMPEDMPDRMSDRMPEDMPDRMPEEYAR